MSKAYRGVLKARISKLYGGDVTIAKAKALKNRKDATPRDKQLANWFINMQTNRPSPNKKRKDPVLTVLEQRARVMGKMEQARLAKAAKATLKRQRKDV
jgi:hypothetical protein